MKCFLTSLLVLVALHEAATQTNDYYDRMNHVFGGVDKSKVTTGYLKEFGVRLNDVEEYNGVLSTVNWADLTQWQSLYNSLYSMRVGPAASSMAAPATVFSYLKVQQESNPGVVLLAAQRYTY